VDERERHDGEQVEHAQAGGGNARLEQRDHRGDRGDERRAHEAGLQPATDRRCHPCIFDRPRAGRTPERRIGLSAAPSAADTDDQPPEHGMSIVERPVGGHWVEGRAAPILGDPRERARSAPRVQEMVIYGVSFDMVGKQPIVLLKAVDTNKFLPIWIGHPEAAAILMKLQGASTPRPMTHDLLFDMLGELEVSCTRVSVTELRENTFYASITLSVNGREVEIDSRPSDALALAVRSGAPIFAAEDVIAESAIEFEHEVEETEEVVDKFKEFLDRVSPEDFAGGDD
jgi:bifunctional DNase/RNase